MGLRVTIPFPLGKNSLPMIVSRRELLPVDWDPTTAIIGRLIYQLMSDFRTISYLIERILEVQRLWGLASPL